MNLIMYVSAKYDGFILLMTFWPFSFVIGGLQCDNRFFAITHVYVFIYNTKMSHSQSDRLPPCSCMTDNTEFPRVQSTR